MALQYDRVRATADAIADLCNRSAVLLADINQCLEYNSDQAIDWGMAGSKTFTAANATNIFTSTAHGFALNQKIRVSNSGGALPAGLVAGTDYFIIAANLAANTFQLSATLGGAAVDITSDGTGTQTAQPVPDYITLAANGNLQGYAYTPAAVSNAIGSLDWVRKLLTNQSMTGSQGDHLGNLNQLGRPLG